jgi:signal transduction histidine kinase/ligand-binding sensor domain-containing protein/ActR/RegA family two-component response regulator
LFLPVSVDRSQVMGRNSKLTLRRSWRLLPLARRTGVLCLLLAAACAALPHRLLALDPSFLFSQYRQNLWTADNGLPASSVFSVAETKDGFLWIGTSDGLARFDGVEFERFTQTDSPALSDPSVFTLLAASDGSLWLGTNSTLVRHSHGRFESVSAGTALSGAPINALAEDADGTIWIGTDDQGLFAWRQGRVISWSKEHGQKLQAVTSLLTVARGRLWIGTSRGLFQLSPDGLIPYRGFPRALANHAINTLMRDTDGSLWVGTDAGVAHVRKNKVDLYTERDGLPRNMITQILRDKRGTLWLVCLRGGLAALRGNRLEAYGKEKNEWLSNPVCAFEDREENLWVGLRSGLLQLQDIAPQNFGVPEGLPNGYMSSVMEDHAGTIWAGSRGGGLYRYAGRKWSVYPIADKKSPAYVYSVYEDRKGSIWVGTGGNRVFRLSHGQTTSYVASDRAGNGANGFAEDGDGVLWVSTIYGGLSHFNGRAFKTLHKPEGLISNDLSFVAAAHDGCVWAGGAGGLSRICHGSISNLTTKDGLPEGTVTAFHEDANQVMWVGTSDGLVRYDGHRLVSYKDAEGLPAFSINSILEREGYLWLGSTHGVVRVSKSELEAWAKHRRGSLHLETIDHGDGMRSAECSSQSSSPSMAASDGHLWFATTKGLVVIDPDHLRPHVLAPPVAHIDPGTVNDQAFDAGAPIENAHLAFRFRAPRFSNPERILYQYRLEGFDVDWQDAGGRRSAFYTNLPPGHYELKVRASDGARLPYGPTAIKSFELLPRFYQTLRFRIAAVLLSLALALMLARLRFRALELRNADLERKVAERTGQFREAAEQARVASSAKSEFFAKVSHEIRTPMNAVIGGAQLLGLTGLDPEQAELTNMIRTSGAALLTLINDLLDLSKVEAGKLELAPQPFSLRSSVQTVRAMLLPLAAKKSIRFTCKVDPSTPDHLTGDITRIQQILINLLSNAVKFTDRGTVELEIHSDPPEGAPEGPVCVHFEVSDTGVGLPKEKLALLFQPFSQGDCQTQTRYGGTGLGLAICKQLVELMNGGISAEGHSQGGATFRFFVKLPLSPESAVSAATPAVQAGPAPAVLNLRTNILLAEDNLTNQKVALRMLQKLGFAADIAANGQEVLEKLGQRPYDLILMDMQMPEMDGMEAARRIRAQESTQPTIIALSANVHREAVEECFAAGMNGFLAKPITLEALQEALLKAVPAPKINEA